MRHKKKINHLSRQRGHRKAMLSNMASSLIVHKRIKTTTAKAKALKVFVEPLITKAKEDTTHSRRQVFKNLQDKEATNEMFREVAIKVGDRPGGYTRIIKIGNRLGDNADMCIIELVDYNENLLAEKASAKSGRKRRGSKKKAQTEGVTPEVGAAEETVDSAEELVEEDNTVEATSTVDEAEVTPSEEEQPQAKTEEKAEDTAVETPAEVVEEEKEEAVEPAKAEKAEEPKDESKDEEKKAEDSGSEEKKEE